MTDKTAMTCALVVSNKEIHLTWQEGPSSGSQVTGGVYRGGRARPVFEDIWSNKI
jgi:hypothetical protein